MCPPQCIRKLDDRGIGELSFDEVYRALLLGAVPPALVTDAVRLLAAGRPGEGGGASFLSGEAAAQAYYGKDGGADVSAADVVVPSYLSTSASCRRCRCKLF